TPRPETFREDAGCWGGCGSPHTGRAREREAHPASVGADEGADKIRGRRVIVHQLPWLDGCCVGEGERGVADGVVLLFEGGNYQDINCGHSPSNPSCPFDAPTVQRHERAVEHAHAVGCDRKWAGGYR